MASLAVLPLFGWLRRQFDDQVATVACILYAVHPKLLVFSPLMIRDPTFWFLLAMTLYLGWRAVVEVKWWLFFLTSVTFVLAVCTPHRGLAAVDSLGTVVGLALASGPGTSPAPGFGRPAYAGDGSRLDVPAERHDSPPSLAVAGAAQRSPRHPSSVLVGTRTVAVLVLLTPHLTKPKPIPVPVLEAIRKTIERFVKAFTYFDGLLILFGVWYWRRVLFHGDQLAMVPFGAVLVLLVGIRYAKGFGIDIRYFLRA